MAEIISLTEGMMSLLKEMGVKKGKCLGQNNLLQRPWNGEAGVVGVWCLGGR